MEQACIFITASYSVSLDLGLWKAPLVPFFFLFSCASWLVGSPDWVSNPHPLCLDVFDHMVCGMPWPGIEPGTPAVKAWSPNYCTAREVPPHTFFDFESLEPAHGLAQRGCPPSVCRIRVFKQASFCHGLLFFQSSIDFQWRFYAGAFLEKKEKNSLNGYLTLVWPEFWGAGMRVRTFPFLQEPDWMRVAGGRIWNLVLSMVWSPELSKSHRKHLSPIGIRIPFFPSQVPPKAF